MKQLILSITLVFFSLTIGMTQSKVEKIEQKPIPEPEISTTNQSVVIDGKTIELTAKAGTMTLRDEGNEPIALFGFTSYTLRESKVKQSLGSHRPIVFAFNGGPGSSSYWLHMGVLGPKRIVVNDPDFTPAAPYQIVNNEYAILDVADLVMIDPVGTGLSIPVGKAKGSDFWGVDQDIRSISLFITQYLIENDRMNSPKYLLGESYGTFRNAGIMSTLLRQGIAMNGVIMVSAVFDLRTLLFPPNDDMPYVLYIPTYAATAWYHNKLENKPEDLEAFIAEVRIFTEETYLPALFKGNRLKMEEKKSIAEQLQKYTGLKSEFWLRADLRVQSGEFFQELLRDEGQTVGRLDSRYKGVNDDLLSQFANYDPQSLAISPAFTTGFLDYLYRDLKVNKKLRYNTSAYGQPGFKWDWSHRGNKRWNADAAINTGPDMARALNQDPNMKVLILNGYFDLATVFYGVEYSIDHLGLTPDRRDNIIMKYYHAGHMMYTNPASMVKFKKDVAEFILNTSGR